ncbi:PREDICTED: carbonic anhydrase 1-like [Nicrophorus vespilloides]|uniref:Carbonic anhydrase 1-like n=1 Tax=Nicrophorus vespilloides TaxID=110193 RepID=A0ABM1MBX8_NICVS|nr:PREDICTED: carbonic anhydrase 1-like [Nicrophorus vespilloides]
MLLNVNLKNFPSFQIVCVIVVVLIVLGLFFGEFARWVFKWSKDKDPAEGEFFRGYQIDNPEIWRYKFCKSKGRNQSPINVKPECSMVVPCGTQKPLLFNQQYFNMPKSITIMNDGYGVLVGTCFTDEFPTVSGGPLKSSYRFNVAQFKWGPTDEEGSEHTINSKRYAMELQLMHIKGEQIYENLDCAVRDRAVLFISYLFDVTPLDNPYLAPIVDVLPFIRCANSSYHLNPFPLCWMFHPFRTRYFFYQGSITCPPCTEGVDWIIQPEPLSISSNQLQRFRSLMAIDGAMRRNTRPVQKINSRTVYYYD